jgi:hypothetical protein
MSKSRRRRILTGKDFNQEGRPQWKDEEGTASPYILDGEKWARHGAREQWRSKVDKFAFPKPRTIDKNTTITTSNFEKVEVVYYRWVEANEEKIDGKHAEDGRENKNYCGWN